jgi:hypothetical protein
MRARLLLVTSGTLVLAVLTVPARGAGSAPKGLRPYSPEWLALNHTRYDNR